MIEPELPAFSEADEQLFQQVRAELLGKVPSTVPPPSEPALEEPRPPPPRTPRRLWWMLAVLGLLAATGSILGWLFPESFGGFGSGSVLLLALIGLALLVERGKQTRATRKQSPAAALPSPPPSPWRRFLISFLWFVLLGVLLFTPLELAWLIGVILLHELGHFVGMRYFGYRDVHMFFIPLFGAAVKGDKRGVPAWQEAIVLLMGPLPGLLLGCTIYSVDLAVPLPVLRTGAAWLVALNFLNLLPFEPLDGGRLCNRLLFSRFRWLEAATLVGATMGLVLVCWGPGWPVLLLSGAFALVVLVPARYKIARAATALQGRWPQLPTEWAELSEAQWRDLFLTTRTQFGADPKWLPGQMRNVYARALQRPESGPVTAALFAVYLGALLLAIVTASVTHLADDAGRWPIRIKHQVTGSAAAPASGQ